MTGALLVLLHVLTAAAWVGGMAALHFAVRPAAALTLEPPQRLAFLSAALGRFFGLVTLAIALLLGSGFALIARGGGMATLHWSVHAMLALGLAMVAIFGHLHLAAHPRLQRAVGTADWPAAATALAAIRRLVAINLALGTLVFAVAIVGPAL